MKRILSGILSLLLICSNVAQADTCATNLMPAFAPNQAIALCQKLNDSISESLIPQTDNAIDLGSTSKTFRTLYTGTSRIAKTSDILRVRQDAQRLFTWDASSDTAFTQTFGDGGTTAAQVLTISGSTADADDDSTLILASGGATGDTRGSFVSLIANEAASGGDATVSAGNVAGGEVYISAPVASSNIFINGANKIFRSEAGATEWTMAATGTLIGAGTATIGWSFQSAANQACTTTCVAPCVIGQDTATFALVACATATADVCVCAGAS